MPDWSRRAFIIRAGAVGVGAVAVGVIGRNLLERQRTPPVGDGPPIPPASVTVPSLTPDQDLSPTIAGLTPIVMPNDRFYRIDTALLTPSVEHDRLDAAHPRHGRPRDDPDLGPAHRSCR